MASTLSKSKYLAGLQCPRRLWLACHQPELGTSPSAGLSASFDEGAEIGRRARELFAGGVVVDDAAWGDGEAMARTRQLLADPQVGAIFEAAFEHAGVRVRVDVLERLPDGAWGLREVKASTRVRDVHLHDVAVQRFVVEGAGVRLDSVEVMHVEPDYVRGDAGIDWPRFFRRTDVNAETTALLPDVPARVAALQRVLELPAAPVVEPGFHCFEPYGCDFWSHCTAGKPADWVFRLPWLDADVSERLRAAGIERITDIPEDFPLGAMHARARTAWRAGALHVEPTLAAALASTGPPADYLDFETAFAAIPLYAGTRPYQQVPFQWSLHRADAEGRVTHHEFLADTQADPRPAFADALLHALHQSNGPILVWSAFEAHRLDGTCRRAAGSCGRARGGAGAAGRPAPDRARARVPSRVRGFVLPQAGRAGPRPGSPIRRSRWRRRRRCGRDGAGAARARHGRVGGRGGSAPARAPRILPA